MNWIRSSHFKPDAQFLWHCWWLPKGYLSLEYGKGIAALLCWEVNRLKSRYDFWHKHAIAELSHDGGIEVNQDVFELFRGLDSGWESDRNEALNRLLSLLESNVKRHEHCTQAWIYWIIWHWQQLEAGGRAACSQEAELLLELAQIHFPHLPLREVA